MAWLIHCELIWLRYKRISRFLSWVQQENSPEVDLVLLAEDPLVFAGQVSHVQKFL